MLWPAFSLISSRLNERQISSHGVPVALTFYPTSNQPVEPPTSQPKTTFHGPSAALISLLICEADLRRDVNGSLLLTRRCIDLKFDNDFMEKTRSTGTVYQDKCIHGRKHERIFGLMDGPTHSDAFQHPKSNFADNQPTV